MSTAEVAAWCPSPRAIGPAELRDHRLAFLRRSIRWGGGAADIVPSPGDSVWGVLWELPLGLGELDAREGAGWAYRRREVEVLTDTGSKLAIAYEVIRKEAKQVPPTADYMKALLTGAREHGLPEAWLQRMEQWYYTF